MLGKFTIVISVKYTLQHCQVLAINTLTRQGAIAYIMLLHFIYQIMKVSHRCYVY